MLKRRKSGLKLNTTSATTSSKIDFPETPQAVRQEVDKARKQWLDEGKEIISESVEKLEGLEEAYLDEDLEVRFSVTFFEK